MYGKCQAWGGIIETKVGGKLRLEGLQCLGRCAPFVFDYIRKATVATVHVLPSALATSIMPTILMNAPLASHSTPNVGYSTISGADPQSPLSKAFARFCSTFGQAEKASFSDLTLSDVFARLEHLDRVHFSSSKVRRLIARLEPCLYFLDRHAKALDSMMQFHPNTSALIWGSLRVILEVRHGDCYDCLPVITLVA